MSSARTARTARREARWSRVNAPLAAAAAATLACTLLAFLHESGRVDLPGLRAIEEDTVDARFVVRGPRTPKGDDIAIVGFDDALRTSAPDVFQKRAGWGRFLDALAAYEPRVVAIDAFFASPEIPLPPGVVEQVRSARAGLGDAETARSPAVAAAGQALQAVIEATRGDDDLAAALGRAGNVLLGSLFFLEGGEAAPLAPGSPEPPGLAGARYEEAVVLERPLLQRPPRAERSVYSSLELLARAAAGSGFVNVAKDEDGKVRRAFTVVEHGGRYYKPLSLAAVARLTRPARPMSHVAGESAVGLGDLALPVDPRGVALLSWLGREATFPTYSGAAVLTGELPKERLRNRVVFVGYTDAARDRFATPFDPALPGVEIHATLAHNALHGELMSRASPLLDALAVLLLGALLTLLQLRRLRLGRAWLPAAGAVVALAGWLALAQALFAAGTVLAVASTLTAVLVVGLASVTVGLATEGREKAQLKAAFSQYVSGALVDRLLADPSRVRLGGERRELTVLFSDIRSFSSFSERMDPQALSSFLNEYLTPMTHAVLDEGGMLDKYIGDAVMGVYGAPLELPDHAAAACRSALRMQGDLCRLNEGWQARGLPEIRIGVGLNSGPVSVGNMGSEVRFDYTVMGDTVNLGSRLEALTKEYKTGILVAARTRELAGEAFLFRELDFARVKGRGGSLPVFELLGEAGDPGVDPVRLELYGQALERYRARDWQAASAALQALLEAHPDDGPAKVMVGRLNALEADPPPEGWDGVYEQRSK